MKKNAKNKSRNNNVRIMIKCGWNGIRRPIPTPVNIKTTSISHLLHSMEDLPALIWTGGTIVFMRNMVGSEQWDSTKLTALIGDDGDCSGGVLLTLNLPSEAAASAATLAAASSTSAAAAAASSAAAAATLAAVAATSAASPAAVPLSRPKSSTAAASTSSLGPAPMEEELSAAIASTITTFNSNNATSTTPSLSQEEAAAEAMSHFLLSNFDASSKETLPILFKLIDNLVKNPSNLKFQQINLSNNTIRNKVASKNGAIAFLESCGFQRAMDMGVSKLLFPENGSLENLLNCRVHLVKAAREVDLDNIPLAPRPPPATSSINANNSSSSSSSANNNTSFNIYKTKQFNVQAAAAGVSDPYDQKSKSKIDRELESLKKRQQDIENKLDRKKFEREICAYRPNQNVPVARNLTSGNAGGGFSDGGLLAQRMKRMEEERKKREEGGFTTKAMRDLEKIKKAKVYPSTTLRISFPDGHTMTCKFKPRETIKTVKSIVCASFINTATENNIDMLDIYIAPPRRVLQNDVTLENEGLVPAARVHVGFKTNMVGTTIKPELFHSFTAATTAADVTPETGMSIAEPKKDKETKGKMSEDDLMKRMLGQPKSGLGGSKKKKGGGGGGGMPSWFKK